MTRYAVLLRGVNVGGHNKVPMARLRELATGLGYSEVATYVQSGNLVVSAATDRAPDIESAVADALRQDLDVDVSVMVRTRDEMAAVIDANPLAAIADDSAKLLVSFLAEQPAAELADALDRDEFRPERFEIRDRSVYMWCPNGFGRSKLAVVAWDRRLRTRGTARNWRTVTALLDLLDAPASIG